MRRVFRLACLLFLTSAPAHAFDFSVLDLGVKTGIIIGTLKSANEPNPFNYGGFPVILAYNLDLTRKLAVSAEMGFILDTTNFQITRSGLDFVVAYHLLGGSRRIVHTYGNIEVAARD